MPHLLATVAGQPESASRIETPARRPQRDAARGGGDDAFAAILDRANAARGDAPRAVRNVDELASAAPVDAPVPEPVHAPAAATRAVDAATRPQTAKTQQAQQQHRANRQTKADAAADAAAENAATPPAAPAAREGRAACETCAGELPTDTTSVAPVSTDTASQAPAAQPQTPSAANTAMPVPAPVQPINANGGADAGEMAQASPVAVPAPPLGPMPAPDGLPVDGPIAAPNASTPTPDLVPQRASGLPTPQAGSRASSADATGNDNARSANAAVSAPSATGTPPAQTASQMPAVTDAPANATHQGAANGEAGPRVPTSVPQPGNDLSPASAAALVVEASDASQPAQHKPAKRNQPTPSAIPAGAMQSASVETPASSPPAAPSSSRDSAKTVASIGDDEASDSAEPRPAPPLAAAARNPNVLAEDANAAPRHSGARNPAQSNAAFAAQLAQQDPASVTTAAAPTPAMPGAMPAEPARLPADLAAANGDKAADEIAPVRHAITVPTESAAPARVEGGSETAATRTARTPMHPAIAQVAVSVTKAAQDGVDRITIKLQPPELGRIDVRLEVGIDGRIQAVFAAERPATVEILQRDVRELERALQSAGLSTDAGSLSFGLKQNGGQNANAFAAFQRDGGPAMGSAADDETPPPPRAMRASAEGRLDIHV